MPTTLATFDGSGSALAFVKHPLQEMAVTVDGSARGFRRVPGPSASCEARSKITTVLGRLTVDDVGR
jgi:hypothetical protein